ncbi:MAG TPA: enoyl-CoA hydratase [Pirellulales bacterium]|jgi:enoyl-CoA hydratase/carnithine racemase
MSTNATGTETPVSGPAKSAASAPLVRSERSGAVAILTLANPARRNALSRALLTELREHFRALAADAGVKCVILRAEGPAFSAGHDLRELQAASETELTEIFALCTQVMEAIRLLPTPVIAEVQGVATAAGCQLAATCDLVIAADDASFATPGVRIGLFCSTPAVALARAVSTKKALEMLLTGEAISATEAERAGLVTRVVPRVELSARTLALAQQIATSAAGVLAIGKRTFYEQLPLDRSQAYSVAEQAMVDCALSADAKEGIAAFLEKRPPKWPE